jgi:hypothetical protein
MLGGGHDASATQCPSNVSWQGARLTLAVIQARSMGSSITLVSMPFSQ